MSARLAYWGSLILVAALCSCGTTRVPNPSFLLSRSDAKSARSAMAAKPKVLQRPVVVLSGYLDPGIAASAIRSSLNEVVEGGPIVVISFASEGNFDGARDKLIAEIEEKLPSENPHETIEVDVIAHSMGGLIARYASIPRSDGKHLRIARLFTTATPHRGAKMGGGILPINDLRNDMDVESAFIDKMGKVEHSYPIIPYVMLGDQVVGQENASPKGKVPWWVDRRWYESPHFAVTSDDRVLADMFRRLRGEEPFTVEPPASLPENE